MHTCTPNPPKNTQTHTPGWDMQFLTVLSSCEQVNVPHRLFLWLWNILETYIYVHTHVHTHSLLFNSNRVSTISLYWGSLMHAFYTGDRSWVIFISVIAHERFFISVIAQEHILISVITHEWFAYRWSLMLAHFLNDLYLSQWSLIIALSMQDCSFWVKCTSHSDCSLWSVLLFSLIYERSFVDERFCIILLFTETVTYIYDNYHQIQKII